MRKICSIILLFTCLNETKAQQVWQGIISDAATGKGIDYVNIGFPGKTCGTLSNDSGYFRLELPGNINTSDTLIISRIGYRKMKLDYARCRQLLTQPGAAIALEAGSIVLKPFVLEAGRKGRKKEYGHFSHSVKNKMTMSVQGLGGEMGAVIAFSGKQNWLRSLRFYVIHSSADTLLFRLNIYRMSADGPAENVCPEQILIPVLLKEHEAEVNLEKYQLLLTGTHLVSLEWVKNTEQKGSIELSATQKNSMFYRPVSQSSWLPYDKGSLALSIRAFEYE